MLQLNGHNNYYIFVILLAILIIAMPASAFTVAIYGTNSGFNPDLHKDSVAVANSIPGSSGSELDSNVDQFTDPSIHVIILSGDDSFSLSTAAKIETAVASGKILVITYPGNHQFDASLPATDGGITPGGQALKQVDPARIISKEIFNGLPSEYPVNGTPPEREHAVARKGAVTLLNYDTGAPALLYMKYGKGYVIEWTTVPVPAYMAAEDADTINYRLITRLLPAEALITPTIIPLTTSPNLNETATATSSPTGVVTLPPAAGNVTVHSSPPGASILIDGVYVGITPDTVTSIPPGNHIIRMSLSGYYDYEGTIYILAGQTTNAFGTLPPLNQISGQSPVSTPIVITVPVTAETTQQPGMLDNSIIVAIIGVLTAVIGAGATLFSHISKTKKE
jgi:hypothetical protein